MKKRILQISTWTLVGFFVAVLTGCTRDVDDELSLFGDWVEEAPVDGRTELYFYSNDRVTRTSDGMIDDYVYSISGDSIYLRPEGESAESQAALFFRQINQHSFQIQNLYPAIPELEPTFMIFVRKSSLRE